MNLWKTAAQIAEKDISSSYEEKILCHKGTETLNKVAWRFWGFSVLVDIQNLTNQGSGVTSNLLDCDLQKSLPTYFFYSQKNYLFIDIHIQPV